MNEKHARKEREKNTKEYAYGRQKHLSSGAASEKSAFPHSSILHLFGVILIETMFRGERIFIIGGALLTAALLFTAASYFIARADTNISATTTEHFAWDDTAGWWNFYDTGNIEVQNTKVTGYASSSFGYLSLDCFTSPNGNICSASNDYYGVCNGPGPRATGGTCPSGDASGVLSGWAWSDEIGWVSFNCSDPGVCGTSDYKVQIDSEGNFSGWAWNDVTGWISFNCGNESGCGISDYKVVTEWRATSSVGYLESSIFDTRKTSGGLLNSIVWQGTSPGAESCVSFQIAVSNSHVGPWNYEGPSGDDSSYYGASCESAPNGGIGCADDNTPTCVNKSQFTNYRYLRYKVRLQSTLAQTSPEVGDIILNWSP